MSYAINNNIGFVIERMANVILCFLAAFYFFDYSADRDVYFSAINNSIYTNEFPSSELLFWSWFIILSKIGFEIKLSIFLLLIITTEIKFKQLKYFSSCHYSCILFVYISYYYLLHDCTQLRISCALSFGLLSCNSIRNSKYFTSVGYLLLAIGFHISIIILPLIFFICSKYKAIVKIAPLFFLICFLFYLFDISILNFLTHSIVDYMGGKYIDYTTVFLDNQQNTSGLAFYYYLFLLALIFYMDLSVSRLSNFNLYALIKSINIYGLGLMFLFYETVAIASRLADVVLIFMIPLFCMFFTVAEKIHRIIITIILICVFVLRLNQLF